MSKISFTNKSQSVSNPLPDVNQFKATDANQIKDSVNALYNVAGWVEYKDLTNTISNKQTLTASQENTLTIDGASTIKTYKPQNMGTAELWSGNKIRPLALGDFYNARIDFTAEIANADGYFDIGIYIDGAIGYAVKNVERFPKGNGVAHGFSLNYPIYCLETFMANGGEIRITPSHTMLIWGKRIILNRTFSNV